MSTNSEELPIVLYTAPDGAVKVKAVLQDETMWLTQAGMSDLFDVAPQNITYHLKNVYKSGELAEAATCKEILQVQHVSRGVADQKAEKEYEIFNRAIWRGGESMNWKVLSSKRILSKPWMTVRADEVELPNGHVIPRGVRSMAAPCLDAGECLTCEMFEPETVRQMLIRGEFVQSLMAAPLWKLFAFLPRRASSCAPWRIGRISLCALMLICGVESAAQTSAATHFTNPVLRENWPDPAFWRGTNGTFYSVATGLRTIAASSNLIDWVDMGRKPLTTDAAAKLMAISRNWWAPCVKRLEGRWVLYISHFNTDVDCSISVLVSDIETGPFTYVRTIVDGKALGIENAIDPFVVETEGRVWMFFGSDQDGIHRVELARDGLRLKSGAEIVHVAGLRKKVPGKSQWGDQGCWEGSYLHPHGGWWYLFCSGGRYDIGDYHLTVGRAKRIDGIFHDRAGNPMTKGLAKPILASEAGDRFVGPGHNGEVFVSSDGREWMFFHAHDVTREKMSDRPTLLQELKWTADDWPYFDGGKPKLREECFEVKR